MPSQTPLAATDLVAGIDAAIEPFDAAGMLDRRRRDWYPALANELPAGATKLSALDEIARLLARTGMVPRETVT